jgi:acid phosphatase family membrane protein YuiD
VDFGYAVVAFVAWLAAGSIKFVINSIKTGQLAFGQIGYGGLPSNHSAIVSSAAALVAIREGFDHPAFGVAVALAFVVVLDANSLRRQVGKHAEAINRLIDGGKENPLRERMGHSRLEIVAGIVVGIISALVVDQIFSLFA